ncbi:MAG: hypothetical protein HYX38_19445 [Rhodospirillales bacterium]|nr:hypothetical protein [Rhodospirillales bacterium]
MDPARKPDQPAAVASERRHLDDLLDQALADTFPASDPVSIDFEAPVDKPAVKGGDR